MRQFLYALGGFLALAGCTAEHGFSEVPERAEYERAVIEALTKAPLGTRVYLMEPGSYGCGFYDCHAEVAGTICNRRTVDGEVQIDIRRRRTTRDQGGYDNPISPLEGCELESPRWKSAEVWATTYKPGRRVVRVGSCRMSEGQQLGQDGYCRGG